MASTEPLTELIPGMPIIVGGDRLARVSDELAAAFASGDRIVTAGDEGTLLHIPADIAAISDAAVERASSAFAAMGTVDDAAITAFFEAFADRLADDSVFEPIATANAADVAAARDRGRSVTRLVLSPDMRADMISGLRGWAGAPSGRGAVESVTTHEGWSVATVRSALGVVGFVFEGRPNVFADACGVIRSGNTVVFRIGSDALGTARAIVEHALDPALADAGLPPGSASLVASAAHAAGWALFSDSRLGLAVARGSGAAVAQLGDIARQRGTPVSLHGTGGAWIVAAPDADVDWFRSAVLASLDRKVCNTLNTCCIPRSRPDLVEALLAAMDEAALRRDAMAKLHVVDTDADAVPASWWEPRPILRADGPVDEPGCEVLSRSDLGLEWEWEESPEVTLCLVADVDDAVDLFNAHSPRFAAALISEDSEVHDRFFARIEAPFVGNGFTRWVDGQYAFDTPELGLSNWQFGRLFGRGGVLSGDSVYTVRARVTQDRGDVAR